MRVRRQDGLVIQTQRLLALHHLGIARGQRRGEEEAGADQPPIEAAPITNVTLKIATTTDSIMATEEVKRCGNIRELTIAPLLAEAMRRISDESSVSSLFD